MLWTNIFSNTPTREPNALEKLWFNAKPREEMRMNTTPRRKSRSVLPVADPDRVLPLTDKFSSILCNVGYILLSDSSTVKIEIRVDR